MSSEESLLVAIMNDARDFELARDDHWYRIPVDNAVKWGKHHWPPRWLAFYQTASEGGSLLVRYYAHVHEVREVQRRQLFPDELDDKKADNSYYQLILSPLQILPRPIPSLRFRRVTFIPTTWRKFRAAAEINDLWDESPLEDRLWTELKRMRMSAERQEFVTLKEEASRSRLRLLLHRRQPQCGDRRRHLAFRPQAHSRRQPARQRPGNRGLALAPLQHPANTR